MNEQTMDVDVARCRSDMAELLGKTVAMTRRLERLLGGTDGRRTIREEIDFDAEPTAALRIMGALLLRKARIHIAAVLRANESGNLHSLAVQMRPALECAGQIVFLFQNLFIAPDVQMSPERAAEEFGHRLNVDHYQTLRRITKGSVSPDELRDVEARAQEAAAAFVGADKPKRRKGRTFKHADKVGIVAKGEEWYGYLSEHFSHGRARNWKGRSCWGGVMTYNKAEDEFAFLGLMNYLVNQVTRMNAAAALCPIENGGDDHWKERIEPTLAQLDEVREASRTLVDTARMDLTGKLYGNFGTD